MWRDDPRTSAYRRGRGRRCSGDLSRPRTIDFPVALCSRPPLPHRHRQPPTTDDGTAWFWLEHWSLWYGGYRYWGPHSRLRCVTSYTVVHWAGDPVDSSRLWIYSRTITARVQRHKITTDIKDIQINNNIYNTNITRGQSNLTKSASWGAHSPVRGHPRGSKVVPLNSWGCVSY